MFHIGVYFNMMEMQNYQLLSFSILSYSNIQI